MTNTKVSTTSIDEGAALVEVDDRVGPVAVGAQPLDLAAVGGDAGEHAPQDGGPGDGAGHLGHRVADPLGRLHAAGGHEAERHRRVHVASRDGPDGVGQGHEDEAEGEGRGDHAGGVAGAEQLEAEALGGHPHGDEHEYERSRRIRRRASSDRTCSTSPSSRARYSGRTKLGSAAAPGARTVAPGWRRPGRARRRTCLSCRPCRPPRAGGSPWRTAACGRGRARRRGRR